MIKFFYILKILKTELKDLFTIKLSYWFTVEIKTEKVLLKSINIG